MDWSKIKEQDSRRRNAPLARPNPRRQIIRATHPGVCQACALRIKPLDPITPVKTGGSKIWVHWTKSLSCARRIEGKEHASH